jgi:predicted RNase H-like HicB family nuclease
MKYNIYIETNEDGWLTGQCEQLPQAISQGENLDDLMDNMKDAIELVLEYQREKFLEKYKTVKEYSVKGLTIRHETTRSIKASQRKRVFA